MKDHDPVNHPKHYTSHKSGVECICITEHFGFNLGNSIKYLYRLGAKGEDIEQLDKALWYVEREIKRRREIKWVPCYGDERYEVSSIGNVRRKDDLRLRTPVRLKNGYLTVMVVQNGKHVLHYLHRLVWQSFKGSIEKGLVIRHIDGDKSNCSLLNLDIGSIRDNLSDRRRHGTHYFGGNNPASVLTTEQVSEIHCSNASESSLAEVYGVSRATIGRVRRGESWQDGRTSGEIAWSKYLQSEENCNLKGAIGSIGATLWRSESKGNALEDLEKARYYINREIAKRKKEASCLQKTY